MTKAELKETIEALRKTQKATKGSKAAALDYLKRAGIVNADGKLAAAYRDEKAA